MDSKESRIVKSYDNLLRQVPGLNVRQYEKTKGLPTLKNTTQIENHRRHARESPRRGSYFWTFIQTQTNQKEKDKKFVSYANPTFFLQLSLFHTFIIILLHTIAFTRCLKLLVQHKSSWAMWIAMNQGLRTKNQTRQFQCKSDFFFPINFLVSVF